MKYFANLITVKQFFYIAFSILLVGIAASCKDSKKEFKIDSEFKQYFMFKEGSFWEFALASDSNTKEKVEIKNFEAANEVNDAFLAEFFKYELKSNREPSLELRAVADVDQTQFMSILVRDSFKTTLDSQFKFVSVLFKSSCCFAKASKFGVQNDIKTYADYPVGSKVYHDVVEIIPDSPKHFKKLAFAKNIGLIYREYADGHMWMLKNYSLIQ